MTDGMEYIDCGPDDELHCTCVRILKIELERLRRLLTETCPGCGGDGEMAVDFVCRACDGIGVLVGY